jgi:thiaminase
LLSDQDLEDHIIKPFQFLYPHYFSMSNITKIVNTEKLFNKFKDHYKEETFQPKINEESKSLDLHNISQMQEKLMKASQQLKEGKKHSGDSDHVQDVSSGSEDD